MGMSPFGPPPSPPAQGGGEYSPGINPGASPSGSMAPSGPMGVEQAVMGLMQQLQTCASIVQEISAQFPETPMVTERGQLALQGIMELAAAIQTVAQAGQPDEMGAYPYMQCHCMCNRCTKSEPGAPAISRGKGSRAGTR